MKRLKNPPNAVAAAYPNDPVFGHTFDGVDIAPRTKGTKRVTKSSLKLFLEWENVHHHRVPVAALLEYAIHADDLLDTGDQQTVVTEHRVFIHLVTRRAVRITTFRMYENGLVAAWSHSSNGPFTILGGRGSNGVNPAAVSRGCSLVDDETPPPPPRLAGWAA